MFLDAQKGPEVFAEGPCLLPWGSSKFDSGAWWRRKESGDVAHASWAVGPMAAQGAGGAGGAGRRAAGSHCDYFVGFKWWT